MLQILGDAQGAIRWGRGQQLAPLEASGAADAKGWLKFSLTRIGAAVRCGLGPKQARGSFLPSDAGGLFLSLSGEARVRGLQASRLAVDPNRYAPVFLDELPATPLQGKGSGIGGLALAAAAEPFGMTSVGGVPFCFAPGGLDVSTSLAGIKEPVRLKWLYQMESTTSQNGRLVARVLPDEYSVLHLIACARICRAACRG